MSLSLFSLSSLIDDKAGPSLYRDRKFEGSEGEYNRLISSSTTIYMGNLSFFTTEEQIHAMFVRCGPIRRVVMGLDRVKKTPCGFAFVEYHTRDATIRCKRHLDGVRLDDRYIRVDIDPGFREGRQFGRGRSGGQVRDEFREDYDPARGGWGSGRAEKRPREENPI